MNDQPPCLLQLLYSIHDSHSRVSLETTKKLTKFHKNRIYISTVPLSLEAYPEDIYTLPVMREHHDSYLSYRDTLSLVETSDDSSFPFLLLFPLTPMGPFVKTSTPPIYTIVLLRFAQHFSKIA